jgi:hypothetical protein
MAAVMQVAAAAAVPRSPRQPAAAARAMLSRQDPKPPVSTHCKLTFESTRLKKIIADTSFQVHHPARFRQTFLPTHHNSTVA